MKVTMKLSNLFLIITIIGVIMTGLLFIGSIVFDLGPVIAKRAVIARNANIMVFVVSGTIGPGGHPKSPTYGHLKIPHLVAAFKT